jgi:Uma2 family endonuclease
MEMKEVFMLLDKRLSLPSQRGEPTWEVAALYPVQGQWTEAEYLALDGNHLIELSEGSLEFLPMPTVLHQRIVQFLFDLLRAFVIARRLGEVLVAPIPVQLWSGKFREPDIFYVTAGRITDPRKPVAGVDLAVEVVSPDSDGRKRDLETKRQEYAAAGIPEYWIVDPEQQHILVLTLQGEGYREHGVFRPGTRASSVLLPGFEVDVAATFAAAEGPV